MNVFIHIPKTGGNSIVNTHIASYIKTVGHNLRNPDFRYYKDSGARKCSKFSFAFVRNPWSRLVSSYFYLKTGGSSKEPGDAEDNEKYLSGYSSFDNMLLNWSDELFNQMHFKPQYEWLCDDTGKLLPDFIGKIENFQQDFDKVCDSIGIPHAQLPHNNKTEHKHYTEYYDDVTREIVAEKYAKDIERFGYEFEE